MYSNERQIISNNFATSARNTEITGSYIDVTEEILQTHLIYGASENTAPNGLAASRCLNFAEGASIQRPDNQKVTVIPTNLKYQGTTGLFGAENYFVKVQTAVPLDITLKCFEERFWECAQINDDTWDPSGVYTSADVDYDKDLVTVNTYVPPRISSIVSATTDSFISVNLENLKTGNKYIDAWLDVRLYTSEREEHPYDKMYVRLQDYFYIGFHARNTRRLDYNVEATIGDELVAANAIEDTRYIARSIA